MPDEWPRNESYTVENAVCRGLLDYNQDTFGTLSKKAKEDFRNANDHILLNNGPRYLIIKYH